MSLTNNINNLVKNNSSLNIFEKKWSFKDVMKLHNLPFMDLLYKAQKITRKHFPKNEMQLSTLASIKTGGCPEDCSYCPQSAHYKTNVENQPLMSTEEVVRLAKESKSKGATRFCMGAAWKSPNSKQISEVAERISAVKSLGLETCVTLGMLKDNQAEILKNAGLDYYNHNLDTSASFYGKIIKTRSYQDRIDTLRKVQKAGINVCCGGIVGMGESTEDRISLLTELANLNPSPESVPINDLVPAPGTPLENQNSLDPIDFIKTIAIARIIMPKSRVRLSAGREKMSETMQALCFFAGANSIFYGEKLLTTGNPECDSDKLFLSKLGINISR